MIVTLQQAKDWLGITVATAAQDAALTGLIVRMQAVIERELDWYFDVARAVTEYFDGHERATLFLRQPPVDAEDVVVSTRTGVGYTDWEELILGTDYEVDQRKLIHASYWPYGGRNIKAEYQEGFTVPPGDIVQVLLESLEDRVITAAAAGATDSETLGDYSYNLGDVSAADLERAGSWSEVLNHWRRGRI